MKIIEPKPSKNEAKQPKISLNIKSTKKSTSPLRNPANFYELAKKKTPTSNSRNVSPLVRKTEDKSPLKVRTENNQKTVKETDSKSRDEVQERMKERDEKRKEMTVNEIYQQKSISRSQNEKIKELTALLNAKNSEIEDLKSKYEKSFKSNMDLKKINEKLLNQLKKADDTEKVKDLQSKLDNTMIQ
jgi:hypothetical protein